MTLMLTGCSGKFRLPWESDTPDVSRIATREPLEIPPDLDLLPPLPGSGGTGSTTTRSDHGEGSRPVAGAVGTAAVSGAPDATQTAGSILFGTGSARKSEPVSRDQKEKLPGWIK
ncbi:MAG: DUF3035 domain-containing protein [Magnetococcales bacterium]|nr:DUF3035 domain-containing protein [Magnetococcales bacterium]